MLNKVVFVNLRLHNDKSVYVCELPLYELFIAKALETKKIARKVEIYTLFTHEDYAQYDAAWRDADVIICWDTYTRSQFYVEDNFKLARHLKQNTSATVVFGGAWPSSYAEYYPEFQAFDAVIKGYSIDGVAECVERGFAGEFLHLALGESNYDKYPLDTSYIATDPRKYVVMGTLLGYLSTFGCNGGCKFCVNESNRQLGAGFCARPMDMVKEDIKTLVRFTDFKGLNFRDDHFFAELERANEIIRFTREQGKSINCNLTTTVANADESFFELVEDWGVGKDIYFGMESMFEDERKKVGKPFSDEKLIRFFDLAHKHNCYYAGNLIFGLPFHTSESILAQCDKILPLLREYPGLLVRSNAYIPKHGTSFQKTAFPDIHKLINFHQLALLYQARTEEFQSLLYGDRFDDISIEGLGKSFVAIVAIKRLRQHFPPFAQFLLNGAFNVMERNIRKGAAGTLVSRALKTTRITKTRRILTRSCIRYHRFADRMHNFRAKVLPVKQG